MSLAATRRPVSVSFSGVDAAIDCAAGESILFAGLRAGLNLPYECASGGCGTCRAQLLDGVAASRWEAASGLSERDRRRGDRILMCQSVPLGPCTVRAQIRDEPPREPAPRRLTGRIAARDRLSADTALFVVEAAGTLPYRPGQFVLLEFPDGARRAYSMSRPARPATPNRLELLIRAKPAGAASSWLFERLNIGDAVTIEGPYGKAYAQTPPRRPVICLAGGTGLAPVLAIAEHLMAAAPDRDLAVYVGVRRFEDLMLPERLHALVSQGARVIPVIEHGTDQVHPALGRPRTGLALDHLADDVPELAEYDIYVAGPTPMIDATLRRLLREGTANAARIFFDRFIS
jgi:NAD(P)H-flavin reductase/ferredoxin